MYKVIWVETYQSETPGKLLEEYLNTMGDKTEVISIMYNKTSYGMGLGFYVVLKVDNQGPA